MATSSEIAIILKTLSEYYGEAKTPAQARIYLATLGDIPADILELAAYDHIAENKWFPKVSELRTLAKRIMEFGSRSVHYDDDPSGLNEQRRIYWIGMSAFNDSLAGRIPADQLKIDKAWQCCRREGAVEDVNRIERYEDFCERIGMPASGAGQADSPVAVLMDVLRRAD